MRNNFLIFFRFLSSILIVASSSDGSEPQFCQWEAVNVSSLKVCDLRCTSAKGFHHPILNELICFKEKSVAKPLFVKLEMLHNCECIYESSQHYVYCNPKKSHGKLQTRQCYDACAQYTARKFRRNNKTEAFCGEVEELSLDFLGLLTRRSSTDGSSYSAYSCRCGLHLKKLQKKSEIKKSNYNSTIIPKSNVQFLHECPIEMSPLPNTDAKNSFCSDKCSTYMGYITSSKEFLCFNRIDSAIDISVDNEPCQCGFSKTYNNSDILKHRQHCNPALIIPSIDRNLCQSECSTYTVLRKFVNYELEVFWCGKISSDEIFPSMDWSVVKRKEPKKHFSYHCTCGLETLNKETLPPSITKSNSQCVINQSSDLAKTCAMKPFAYKSKSRCTSSCFEAKAFFLQSNSATELICYHYKQTSRMISFSEDRCECAISVNNEMLACIPKIFVHASSKEICIEKCKNTMGYVFLTYPTPSVTRCVEKDYNLRKIFEKLDSKVGRYRRVITEKGSRSGQHPCECGIRSFLLNNTVSIVNSSRSGSPRTLFTEDRRSNNDVFGRERALEDNHYSFVGSLNNRTDIAPGVDDSINENTDWQSRDHPDLPYQNHDASFNQNNSSHLRTEDLSVQENKSLEAYLTNDEDIPANDLNISSTLVAKFYGETRSSLPGQASGSFQNLIEHTNADSNRDILRDDNNILSDDVLQNASSNKYLFTRQSSLPSEYKSMEAFLMNEDFSLPVGDIDPLSPFYEHEEITRKSSVIFELDWHDIFSTSEMGISYNCDDVRDSRPSSKQSKRARYC